MHYSTGTMLFILGALLATLAITVLLLVGVGENTGRVRINGWFPCEEDEALYPVGDYPDGVVYCISIDDLAR